MPRFLCTLGMFLAAAAAAVLGAEENAPVPPPLDTPETASATATNAIENTVVKVFATIRRPDLYKPWTKSSPQDVTGSGVIIEGRRVLTNAHVVLYASQVQVQAHGAGEKVSAEVEFIAPGIDLAVLKLEDETFFDQRPPIVRATTLPEIKETVLAYGYPTGGTSLSITKGIVSRIEFAGYNLSTAGLRIQIDAAINRGNSGGPAIVGNEMIGLAFSHLGNAQNIGYIIPTEEINLFLADVSDGRYDGKPGMYDDMQTLENGALRGFLGLPKDVSGMIVTEPYSAEPNYPLKRWDVVTKIGDSSVDEEGMVKITHNLRVRFQYLVQKYTRDGQLPLTVVRAGQEMKLQLPVINERTLVMPNLRGDYPSYFVFGPIVFSTATGDFLDGIGSRADVLRIFGIMANPLLLRRGDKPAFPEENLVVVSSPLFPHKLSQGYDNPVARVVQSINGKRVNNLVHLVELLRDSTEDHIEIRFAGRGSEAIVLPRKDAIAATEDILTDNGVRAQGSADTLAVWNKPAAVRSSE